MTEPNQAAPDGDRTAVLKGELARLRSEHEATTAELASAHDRIRELEAARDDALNRIDWVINSLHNVLSESQ